VILMDEPFGALDPITREALQDEIKQLQKKLKKTIVFVTHDMDEALKIADVIILMQGGKIVQKASPEELLTHPANEFVEQFVGKHRISNGRVDKVRDIMISSAFSVPKSTGIELSIELMRQHGVSGALVTEETGEFIGHLGIEEIIQNAKAGMTVADVGIVKRTFVTPDMTAEDAFRILSENHLDAIAVLDENRKILGIVTRSSMVRYLANIVWNKEGGYA